MLHAVKVKPDVYWVGGGNVQFFAHFDSRIASR